MSETGSAAVSFGGSMQDYTGALVFTNHKLLRSSRLKVYAIKDLKRYLGRRLSMSMKRRKRHSPEQTVRKLRSRDARRL
jgi:hypothetical protein